MNYTYILECEDGSYYTGWTNNLEKRFAMHRSGKGAKYTRAHKPVRIAWSDCSETSQQAMKKEATIKKMSHEEKRRLIESGGTYDL